MATSGSVQTTENVESKEIYALSKCFCPSYGETQLSIVKIGGDFKELMKEAEKLSREFIKTQEKDVRSKFKITVGENKMTVSIPDNEGSIPSYDLDQRDVDDIELGDHIIFEIHLVGQIIVPDLKYNYYHDKDEKDTVMGKERKGEEALEETSEEENSDFDEEDEEEEETTNKENVTKKK